VVAWSGSRDQTLLIQVAARNLGLILRKTVRSWNGKSLQGLRAFFGFSILPWKRFGVVGALSGDQG